MFWKLLTKFVEFLTGDTNTPKAQLVITLLENDLDSTEALTAIRGVLTELSASGDRGIAFTLAVKAIDEILTPTA